MSRPALAAPTDTASVGVGEPAGCVRLALELSDPTTGLDALCKVITTMRGRRWDVRGVTADLDTGTVSVVVRTARAELLANLLGRVVAVRSVRMDRPDGAARGRSE